MDRFILISIGFICVNVLAATREDIETREDQLLQSALTIKKDGFGFEEFYRRIVLPLDHGEDLDQEYLTYGKITNPNLLSLD